MCMRAGELGREPCREIGRGSSLKSRKESPLSSEGARVGADEDRIEGFEMCSIRLLVRLENRSGTPAFPFCRVTPRLVRETHGQFGSELRAHRDFEQEEGSS